MLPLKKIYHDASKIFEANDIKLITKILSVIETVTRDTKQTAENALSANQLTFWFQKIIPLMFSTNKGIQNNAIKAAEAVLPFFQLSSYQEHPNWPAVEQLIISKYSKSVIELRDNADSVWYKTWNVLVKMLNKKLLKGSLAMRKFLEICTDGFKSPNFTTRAETFLCWKVLLDIFSQDAKCLTDKAVTLLLIPLKPIAKTPEIALNKHLVWWSLVCKVGNQIERHYDTVLVPFLSFCFGLRDKPILSAAIEGVTHQEVYPQLTMLSVTVLINLLGPVSDITSSLCKSTPIDRIREPLLLPTLMQKVGRILINACGEATFLMKDIESFNAVPVCENMWSNLMNRLEENHDSTLTKLIVQNLTILANASQNDEPAKNLVLHVAINVLSSKHLIPVNLSDDKMFSILKRISFLLASDIIHINDNAIKRIVDNVFTCSTETKRLQHFLTLLQSQNLSSNARVGTTIWNNIANYIAVNLTQNIDTFKEVIYGYIEWLVKYSKIDQLSIFLITWKNMARSLMTNDSELFWHRINEILRLIVTESDGRICKFLATTFELIHPEGTVFPSKFISLVEDVVAATQLSHVDELQPIIVEINNLSEHIRGEHSAATYQSLNELVLIVENKCDLAFGNQFDGFNKFHKNYEHFASINKSKEKPSKWQFRPENLADHQKKKLKEKRVDIPALYNDMSQSQDTQSVSLKPTTPKKPFELCVAEDKLSKATEPSDYVKSTDNAKINDANQQTPNKNDAEERIRKRVQNVLNQLHVSLKNAEQYSQVQGRTRSKSFYIARPESRLSRRSQTETDKPTPSNRAKKVSLTSTKHSESEIIEASQSMLVTPISTRMRQMRISLSKVNTQRVEKAEVSLDESFETDKTIDIVNVSNSRSIEEPVVQASEELMNNQSDAVSLGKTPKINESSVTQTNTGDSGKEDNVNESLVENRSTAVYIASYAEISTATCEEVAIPKESNAHKPIEDAKSEVINIISEENLVSPAANTYDEQHPPTVSGGIRTSANSNKNCSKTTENNTVDVSLIPHAKAVSTDQTSKSTTNQQSSTKPTECCLENIGSDQIKRTELDNQIEQPMGSPMIQGQNLFGFSKELPSLEARPSKSTMKRHAVKDMDDIQPNEKKRKRITFHDPPVSQIRFTEEVNHHNSSLTLDESETSVVPVKSNDAVDEREVSALPPLIFLNKNEVLQHVFEEYSMEDVLGKYFESGFTYTRYLQFAGMTNNAENKRKYILEILSQKFPKEFLDIAFEQNLTSTVYERMQPISMLNYITDQAKIDDNLKMQVMKKFMSLTGDGSSEHTEMKDDLYKILLQIILHKMSDTQLLNVVDVLFEKRRNN